MAGKREQRKQETKKAIMAAAVKLFGQNGFEKTSIEALAREAGIGKGTVYSYFQTKGDILYAFCEQELEYFHKELASKTTEKTSLLDQMVTIYLREFSQVTKDRAFGRLFLQQTLFPPEGEGKNYELLDNKWLELLYSLFEKAQQRGELRRDIDLLYVAGHFYALYILATSVWYSDRFTTDEIEPGMRRLFQQALEGLAPPHEKETITEQQQIP